MGGRAWLNFSSLVVLTVCIFSSFLYLQKPAGQAFSRNLLKSPRFSNIIGYRFSYSLYYFMLKLWCFYFFVVICIFFLFFKISFSRRWSFLLIFSKSKFYYYQSSFSVFHYDLFLCLFLFSIYPMSILCCSFPKLFIGLCSLKPVWNCSGVFPFHKVSLWNQPFYPIAARVILFQIYFQSLLHLMLLFF